MLGFAVYAFAVCFGMFVLMYSSWWERGYKYVSNLHMIRKMYVCCDGLYIGLGLCDCLHEHIWMRASDRTTRGFCLCDYPVYAKENILKENWYNKSSEILKFSFCDPYEWSWIVFRVLPFDSKTPFKSRTAIEHFESRTRSRTRTSNRHEQGHHQVTNEFDHKR